MGVHWFAKCIARWQAFVSVDREAFTNPPTFHTAADSVNNMELENEISKIASFSNEVYNLSKEILDSNIIDKYESPVSLFKYIYLQRFTYFSKSISTLFPMLIEDSMMKIPIGIIFRASMSDLITIFYFFKVFRESKAKMPEKIKEILEEELFYFDKSLNRKKDDGEISDEEYNAYTELLKYRFSCLYPKDGIIKKKNKVTLLTMAKAINNPMVSKAYDSYEYLSKVEHIGIFTDDIQNLKMDEDGYEIKRFIGMYGFYYKSFLVLLEKLNIPEKIKEKINILNEIVEKNY